MQSMRMKLQMDLSMYSNHNFQYIAILIVFMILSLKIHAVNYYCNIYNVNDTSICYQPDTQPRCIDINDDYNKYIMQKMIAFIRRKYPNENIEHVVVKFIIEKNGRISNVQLIKYNNPKIGKFVVRCLRKLKHWFPAKKDDRDVRCLMVFNGYYDSDR